MPKQIARISNNDAELLIWAIEYWLETYPREGKSDDELIVARFECVKRVIADADTIEIGE